MLFAAKSPKASSQSRVDNADEKATKASQETKALVDNAPAAILKLTEKAYVDDPLLPLETSPGAPVVAAADSPQRKRRLVESGSEHRA